MKQDIIDELSRDSAQGDLLYRAATEIARLRKALKPFAKRLRKLEQSHIKNMTSDDDEVYVKIGHLRDAFDALGAVD